MNPEIVREQVESLNNRIKDLTEPPYRFTEIIVGAEGQPSVGVPGESCSIDFSTERKVKSEEELEKIRGDLKETLQPLFNFEISSIEFGFEIKARLKAEEIQDKLDMVPDDFEEEIYANLAD